MLQRLALMLETPRQGRFSLERAMLVVTASLFVQGWLGTSHFAPWVSWHAEVPFFLATLLAACVVAAVLARRVPRARVPLPMAAWPFLLLLGLTSIQFAAGRVTFFGDVVVVGFYLLLCVICLTLGFVSGTHDSRSTSGWPKSALLTTLALSLLAAGLVSTVVAWAQVLDIWEAASWILRTPELRRAGGNMGQPNHLATMLAMAVASMLYLHAVGLLGTLATSTIVVFLSTGIVITQSRSGALGLLLLLIWWAWKLPLVAPQRSRWWAAGVGALFVAMFLAWPGLLNAVQLLGLDGGTVPSHRLVEGSMRFQVWPQLIEAVLMRPWGGWGVRQVAEAHNAVAHAYPVSEPYSYAHNLILDLALWIGLPITALLTVAGGVWLWRRSRATRNLDPWYGLAVALPVAVHAMLEFPHAYAYFLAPTMLALGSVEGSLSARPWLTIRVKTGLWMLGGALTLMAWSAVEYVQAEEDFRVTRFELLNMGQTPTDYERPTILLLTQLGAMLDGTRIQPRQGMPAEQLERLKTVALRYAWSGAQYRYALALALNGDMPEATRQLHVVRALHGEKIYQKSLAQLEERLRQLPTETNTVGVP